MRHLAAALTVQCQQSAAPSSGPAFTVPAGECAGPTQQTSEQGDLMHSPPRSNKEEDLALHEVQELPVFNGDALACHHLNGRPDKRTGCPTYTGSGLLQYALAMELALH